VVSLPDVLPRSYLYGPGSNERILTKVLDAGADAVILDLEDAVPLDQKLSARAAVADLVARRATDAACEVHVRVNVAPSGGSDLDDVRAVVAPGLAALRLPKAEDPDHVRAVAALLDELEAERGIPSGTVRLYPTVESVAGLDRARELAACSPRVATLVYGPADLAADLGIPEPDDRDATLLARSTLVLACRLAGVGAPVDGAYTAVADLDGLEATAAWARRLGFGGKSALHPRQLPALHRVFTPSDEEVAHARAVVASLADGRAVAMVDGGFVDPAVVARAHNVLARHAHHARPEPQEGGTE
jgi:citrate lyase subunit beta/citryl-CoA lyase